MINKKYGISTRQIAKYGFKLALEVYEKYNRKCSVCGTEDRLAIHHIDESGNSNNPNNNLDNLQMLCVHCHHRLHLNKRWEKVQKKFGGYVCKGREKEYRKECWAKYSRENKEKLTEYYKKWSEQNKEKRRLYFKKYYSNRRRLHS